VAASDLSKLVTAIRAQAPASGQSIDEFRMVLEAGARKLPMPEGVDVRAVTVGGVPAERIDPVDQVGGRTLLYLHGGGYALGSPTTGRAMAARVALAGGAAVVSLDYRLAPEHPCPAAVNDAVAAYDALRRDGLDSASLALMGDSAGGGLVIATLVELRCRGAALPVGGVCISPWVDLTLTAASVHSSPMDAECTPEILGRLGDAYRGGRSADDPVASPLFADLRGLPPLLIQVGGAEGLLDDAKRLAAVASGASVDVTLQEFDGMIHVWHRFAPRLREANEAIEHIAAWLAVRWKGSMT